MALRAAQGNEDARETRPWAFEGPRPRWSIEEAAWVGGRRRATGLPHKAAEPQPGPTKCDAAREESFKPTASR